VSSISAGSLASPWRDIRALRADPPGFAAIDEARRKEFGASLQQAEEFAAAASDSGYATKPLQLYYGLSQGFRAVCAAHLDADWRRFGHGLTLSDAHADALIDYVVKPVPRPLDLHTGAMSVVGEEPLSESVTIGELLAALIEFRDFEIPEMDLPRPLFLASPLQRHHVAGNEGPAPAPFLMIAVIGLSDCPDASALSKAIEPYPALDGAVPTTWPLDPERPGGIKPGGMGWIDRDGVAYFQSEDPQGTFPVFRLPFDGDNPLVYRAALERLGVAHPDDSLLRVVQPATSKTLHPLGALVPWWALLLGLSSLARYHASQWNGALAIDHEPIAPALERVIDLAEEIVPLYLLDGLTTGPEQRKRTPVLGRASNRCPA